MIFNYKIIKYSLINKFKIAININFCNKQLIIKPLVQSGFIKLINVMHFCYFAA